MPSIGDLLYAFTEWLRTTPLVELAINLSNGSTSMWLQSHFWAIPIMQTLHILSIAAAFGSVLMINFRILGITGRNMTMTQTARRYLPWIWSALALLIITGIGMIFGEPVRELINPIFWVKMVAVVVMILASVWFQASVRRRMADWETTHDGRAAIRAGAVGIIILWCGIMVAGRWIAYAPV
jgi:magnesium-transporting ATPase (P-type)